jgi:hypothetical protein
MNKNQFEIDDKTRLKLILSHISTHQGCIKADLENAFDGKISKKTINKIVDENISADILCKRRERKQ